MESIDIYNHTFKRIFSYQKIDEAAQRIGSQLNNTFNSQEPPVFLCILDGAFMFTADLMKQLDFHCNICFVKLSSYEGCASSGSVKELIGINIDIQNRDVIIVEDIIDTGLTIGKILNTVKQHNPKSVQIATMFFKKEAYKEDISIDYVGLEVPNQYLIGYGLDYSGFGRNFKDLYGANITE